MSALCTPRTRRGRTYVRKCPPCVPLEPAGGEHMYGNVRLVYPSNPPGANICTEMSASCTPRTRQGRTYVRKCPPRVPLEPARGVHMYGNVRLVYPSNPPGAYICTEMSASCTPRTRQGRTYVRKCPPR